MMALLIPPITSRCKHLVVSKMNTTETVEIMKLTKHIKYIADYPIGLTPYYGSVHEIRSGMKKFSHVFT